MAARRVEATQRELLARYLRQNAATEFGRQHEFSRLDSWESYADRVPVRTYDEYEPWILAISRGAGHVLTADRVRLLEPTSGSSGAEKWVPYTRTLQAELRRGVATWISGIFLARPAALGGRAYWSLTPQGRDRAAAETTVPVGFDDDSAYLGGLAAYLAKLTLATGPELKAISDRDRFWYQTLLQLVPCRDLRLVSVWHPSFLLLLLAHLRRNWDALRRDMRSQALVRGNALASMDPARPLTLWPQLQLISCWGDASASAYLDEIRAEFPGVAVQPKGLVATEAFATLPLGELRPLAVRSHFFEFRDDDGGMHPAWSLCEGGSYSLVVTTGGGLYRYALRDRVEVTGYYGEIPSLRFVGKDDAIVDHFGEKLSEAFVATCMDSVFARHGFAAGFAMLALDPSGAEPGYRLYVEAQQDPPADLAGDLETALRQNPHYRLCVDLGQLAPLAVTRIAGGAYETYTSVLVDRGMRLGDIKPARLSRRVDWSAHFAGTC